MISSKSRTGRAVSKQGLARRLEGAYAEEKSAYKAQRSLGSSKQQLANEIPNDHGDPSEKYTLTTNFGESAKKNSSTI
eukprot:1409275-Pleurochrysis_carterae.AAC.1